MSNIENDLISRINHSTPVDYDFVAEYVYNYVKIYHLRHYYKALISHLPEEMKDSGSISLYNAKDKKHYYDHILIMEAILSSYGLKEKETYTKEEINYIYSIYLNYITHELAHAKQNKLVHSFGNSLEKQVIKDSFIAHDRYYNFYLQNGSIFPHEHNANMEACFTVGDIFLDCNLFKDKESLEVYNKFMCSQITKKYERYGNNLMSPASQFYSNFKERNRFSELNELISADNYTRIFLGMPFDLELFDFLKAISMGEERVDNVKEKILKSGQYGKNI